MSDYIKIEFENVSQELKEIAIAVLAEMNYEGFEEEVDLLRAYISSKQYNEEELKYFSRRHNLSFSLTKIDGTNWNTEWESNFQPVIIKHPVRGLPFVGIRAEFHQPIREVEHEIIITPKMSFGTGHHATTSMMISMMSEIEFRGKTVLDFGTGTGILAILAEKLGALKIIAVDSDDQSIDNATENFHSNNCVNIELIKASSARSNSRFDIILANIVKGVILENLSVFAEQLNSDGHILLSGLLKGDMIEIINAAKRENLEVEDKIEIDYWNCLKMTYK
jgi:ribosomal protein L11 methyltransferase